MTKSDLPKHLAFYFARNGYLRGQRDDRREDGHEVYKKGWKISMVLHDTGELEEARRCIEHAGMKPGKDFQKRLCWIQPIYGRDAVMRFKTVLCAPHGKRMKAVAERRSTLAKTPSKKR